MPTKRKPQPYNQTADARAQRAPVVAHGFAHMNEMESPRLLTVSQAAEYLQVSDKHVRRLIKSGRLPVIHVGVRLIRIDIKDIFSLKTTQSA